MLVYWMCCVVLVFIVCLLILIYLRMFLIVGVWRYVVWWYMNKFELVFVIGVEYIVVDVVLLCNCYVVNDCF